LAVTARSFALDAHVVTFGGPFCSVLFVHPGGALLIPEFLSNIHSQHVLRILISVQVSYFSSYFAQLRLLFDDSLLLLTSFKPTFYSLITSALPSFDSRFKDFALNRSLKLPFI
jgi:hypothetical protein